MINRSPVFVKVAARYGPWFNQFNPSVCDFIYREGNIVVGAPRAMTGPVEEFQKPLSYDTTQAGGSFVKVGVGVLRKPDATNYASFRPCHIVDSGTWKVNKKADSIEFTQELRDSGTGYGYIYTKTIHLTAGKPELVMSHKLTNTGRLPIQTNVYDHNILVLDKTPPGPYYTITAPFEIKSSAPPTRFGEIRGNKVVYTKVLEDQERLAFPIRRYGADAKDYDFRVENSKSGVCVRFTGDRPLASVAPGPIRSNVSLEPFLDIVAAPGKDFNWTYTYTY